MNMASTPAEPVHPFDARGIGKRFRHAAIFGALDALHPGETMRFINDHDPLPLLAQLRERYGDTYTPPALLLELARSGKNFSSLNDNEGGAA